MILEETGKRWSAFEFSALCGGSTVDHKRNDKMEYSFIRAVYTQNLIK
jgi:hypothetical protein